MPYIDDDVVGLSRDNGSTTQLFWGDEVRILATQNGRHKVEVVGVKSVTSTGWISDRVTLRTTPLLKMSMVDVQQGDGMIIETPGGKVIFIDGGDNQLFARHAAARFAGTSAADPLLVDLMLVTHGDADHFDGLNELRASETHAEARKRIFVAPRRYYHNGMVKRPSTGRSEKDMLGPTTQENGALFVTGLVEDPAVLPASECNRPFRNWIATLAAWEPRVQAATGGPIVRRRIDHTKGDLFDFLRDEGIEVDLLGPIAEPTAAGPGLRFLRDPPKDARLMLGTQPASGGSLSASHTINGHSVALRLRIGNVRFLLTGDLNQEAAERLRTALPGAALRCEVLKAPHHGSADFDMEFLKEAGPVVSLISSGDESEAKEYIHPRATLMAALGKASRTTPAVIFVTELAAFFSVIGYAARPHPKPGQSPTFFAFERTNFGIAHIRTDGQRVLAFTHSGKAGMNEAYRFTVSPTGTVEFAAQITQRAAPKLN